MTGLSQIPACYITAPVSLSGVWGETAKQRAARAGTAADKTTAMASVGDIAVRLGGLFTNTAGRDKETEEKDGRGDGKAVCLTLWRRC